MKSICRLIMLWLMLLAVPVQGFAAATMMLCGPTQPPASSLPASFLQGPHDHAAMLAAQATAPESTSSTKSTTHHAAGKCGACAACCIGAAMMPSMPAPLPALSCAATHCALPSLFLPSVIPAYPERPPRFFIL